MAELEPVPAPDTNIRLAGNQRHACRLRCPPPLEQLGPGPRLEHEAAGPLKVRVTTSSRSDFRSTFVRSLSFPASIDLLLPFQFLNNLVQLIEACGPELAVSLDPCSFLLQSARAELAGAHAPDLFRGD